MAEIELKSIFQYRRGSTSEWESVNPILREGEPGLDTTLEKIKIGDGITPWKDLPFYGSSIENILDGIASGSVRTSSSTTESTNYKLGTAAFAEGSNTKARGNFSHSEGYDTNAFGSASHAEGWNTNASGNSSHAEGENTTASGYISHAEGRSTTASGSQSHAEGYGTKASSSYQHVQGKFNIDDSSDIYADIIGNGTSDSNKSNTATVDWSGNAWYAGDVYVGSKSGKNKDEGSKKLATEEYVGTTVAGLVDSAPETLNTLNELAAALGDDPNFATTIVNQIGNKVDKVDGKGLSTNDYTTAEKNKLSGIETGANKIIVDSVLSSTSTNPVQNKVINSAISNLSTLVGYTSVSEQISTATSSMAKTDLTNIDNATFKSKVEASGFSGGTKVQIITWEEND